MANGVVVPNEYQYGFSKPENYVFKAKKGLSKSVVEQISSMKNEPVWMREFRLKSLGIFQSKKMPAWGADLSAINFDDIYYYIKPTDSQKKSWSDLPKEIRDTYRAIGVPQAEKKFLAGVTAQYESESVYHSFQKQWEEKGVVFLDMDSGLRKYPDLVKQYFGRSIPPADNKFAALNSAVWSGGSFIYVPPNVSVDIPLQAYFRINAANMGQFERTLIIVDEAAYIHYVEGCSAPVYTTDSLHAAVVEIFVKRGARCRYTTIQNWSGDVYNLVTKRAFVEEDGIMEWVDGNIGCLTENAKLYTNPKGPISIKDLKTGDWVYTTDLNSLEAVKSKVNAVVEQGVKLVFKVMTTNYREIEATANHPFLVLRKTSKIGLQTLRWEKLGDLKAGDWIAVVNELPDDGKPHPIEFSYDPKLLKHKPNIPSATDENSMWLLGLYVGDGCMDRSANGIARRIYYAVPPKDRARKKLEALLKKVFAIDGAPKGISLTINSTVLASLFLSLGFSGTAKTKRIPNWIFGLPRKQKLAFIEGYFDADGYLRKEMKKDGNQYGQIVFASANKQLLEDFKLLMISVGIDPLKIYSYVKERKLYKERLIEYTSHYLSMNIRGNLERLRDKAEFDPTIRFVRIRSIEPIGKQRVYDIEVDKTANFIANGIVVHNSKITMKYPSCYLTGRGARGEILSLALAGASQHQDAGGKLMFLAPDTSGEIISKSVSHSGGRTSYRGLVKAIKGAERVKCNVRCDALILDEKSRSDTYPTMQVAEDNVRIGHEASVSRIDAEQLFYLMSRGLTEIEATSLIVNGFIEPIVKELPLEYAVELNRLIQLNMEGSVG